LVQHYIELFEEVVLKAEFWDSNIVSSTFYNGLKYKVKCNLVGRCPDDFDKLKALTITLDEERIAAQDPERCKLQLKTTTRNPDPTPMPKPEPST
jgi:hypothetical protein